MKTAYKHAQTRQKQELNLQEKHRTISCFKSPPPTSIVNLVTDELTKSVPPSPDHRPATYWVQHTTSCSVQSNAPEDGQNFCPKRRANLDYQ
jgi:hypothetical protein